MDFGIDDILNGTIKGVPIEIMKEIIREVIEERT